MTKKKSESGGDRACLAASKSTATSPEHAVAVQKAAEVMDKK